MKAKRNKNIPKEALALVVIIGQTPRLHSRAY